LFFQTKTLKILMGHKLAQDEEKQRMGHGYHDHGWVFCWEDGTRLRPEWVTGHFKKLLKQTDLPDLRLHDLRHTHATLLLLDGVHIKIVQERLGHSAPGFNLGEVWPYTAWDAKAGSEEFG
jgi:integrase